ncbi:MAG TPA: hypothetical protein VEX36_03210 [Thermoleophilaceae bacterium]|nr:hypothetical protein [Thermoleophilaceae bacterium]
MSRLTTLLIAVGAALLALAPLAAPAAAAKRAKGPVPKITRVTPMRIEVGELLVIRGKSFKSKPRRNTVVFQGPSGRTAFAKPRRASSRKLVVKVPASVARLLVVAEGKQRPTRLKLRVLAGRFSAFTPRRLSPVVLGLSADAPGAGGDGSPAPKVCKSDADHDDDLLSNDDELQYGTDPCLRDTDKDGSSDGWEYFSAKDLNVKAVPYPDRRPYPNPLDPSDRAIDFDGDGLLGHEEYRAWVVTGSSLIPSKGGGIDLESPLGYSDGTQYSSASEVPVAPSWRGPSYGLPAPPYAFPASYDLHGDAAWRDDERDADRDGLSNWLESERGPGDPKYWGPFWAQDEYKIDAWPEPVLACPTPQAPGDFGERPFAALDLADPDVDGDTLLDGEDDQDNDDYSNVVELFEVADDADGNGQAACGFVGIPSIDLGGGDQRIVNPFNPCAPSRTSRTCPSYEPF